MVFEAYHSAWLVVTFIVIFFHYPPGSRYLGG